LDFVYQKSEFVRCARELSMGFQEWDNRDVDWSYAQARHKELAH
jgi:hypothetical protein